MPFRTLHWPITRPVTDFAALAAAEAPTKTVVWVQDFHLAMVPALLREQRRTSPIGSYGRPVSPQANLQASFRGARGMLRGNAR